MKNACVLLLGILIAISASAQSDVGQVAFDNSGSPAAQTAFLRGLALLHNFEYPAAAESFREAQKVDPQFAMAYWGEAMTYTHPVWQQQDAAAARAVLARLGATPQERAAKTTDAREKAYLATVEVLYGDGAKDVRDFRFADAMAALHAQFPTDIDATAFYALALLGTSHKGRDTATYMRAAALLEEIFPTHKNHPGVLHYLIHCYDDPVHAPLGMRAARLYGALAPNAGHALHMTSHIFVALGMWDEVIAANKQAIAVVDRQRAARQKAPAACGHYPTWLHYAFLQERRFKEAQEMLVACSGNAFDPAYLRSGSMDTPENRAAAYADMVANQVASGGPFELSVDAKVLQTYPEANVAVAYARMLAASRSKADGVLTRAIQELKTAQAAVQAKEAQHESSAPGAVVTGNDPYRSERATIQLQQAAALQLIAAGSHDAAIALLRKAADAEQSMPFEFGPPVIQKPSIELLADELLAAGHNEDAVIAYQQSLARTPGRTTSLEGLAAAQKATNDTVGAEATTIVLRRYVKPATR